MYGCIVNLIAATRVKFSIHILSRRCVGLLARLYTHLVGVGDVMVVEEVEGVMLVEDVRVTESVEGVMVEE